MSIAEQVKATLEQMANRASVPMGLWNEHSNAVLEACAHIASLTERAERAEATCGYWEVRAKIARSRRQSAEQRAEALTAEVALLREALEQIADAGAAMAMHDGDLLQGCRDIARQALAAAPAAPETPSGESGWLPADPPAAWIEAMARAMTETLIEEADDRMLGPEVKVDSVGTLRIARAAYAALARQMGGGDAE